MATTKDISAFVEAQHRPGNQRNHVKAQTVLQNQTADSDFMGTQPKSIPVVPTLPLNNKLQKQI